MCGILGYINAEKVKFNDAAKVFNQMLFLGTLRGQDGTGAMVLRGDKLITHKSVLWGPDYLQTNAYRKVIAPHLDQAKFAVGHNRAATRGTISTENAHPFQHKHITLVHNGYIQNYFELLPTGMYHDVDSFSATVALAEKPEKEALESLRGAFALVWHNAEDNTLNIARNDTRELCLAYLSDKEGKPMNTMMFMSEAGMLHDVMVRNFLYPDGKYKLVPPYVHFKFNVDNPREFTRVPFAQPQSHAVSVGSGAAGRAATSTADQRWRGSKSASKTVTNADMDRAKAMLAKFSKRDRALYGIPGSDRKLRNVAVKLAATDYKLGQDILIYADSYAKYKNQRDRGVIMGTRRSDAAVPVQIQNVSQETFENVRKVNGCYATIVNCKRGPTGKLILICCLDTTHLARLVKYHQHMENIVNKNMGKSKPTEPPKGALTYVAGPGGSTIELGKFMAMTSHGCGECGGHINPHFANQVHWMGDNAVCHECVMDPNVAMRLGLVNETAAMH